MTQDGIGKIKSKLQELSALIKEEAITETQEIRAEILESVNEMKSSVEERLQDIESKSREIIVETKDEVRQKVAKTQGQVEGNLHDFLGELERKALKVQYTIQEKLSEGLSQKDEIVAKTADSLIEVINKAKGVLHSEGKNKE